MKQKELVGLQYMRGLAAASVALAHTSTNANQAKYFGHHLFGFDYQFGDIGVDLFFCLSGFIAVYITQQSAFPSNFIFKRFIRIFPLLWIVVSLYALLRVLVRQELPYENYVRSLTLWPVGIVEPGVVWTLRHEMLFYVLFSLTLLARRNNGRTIKAAWHLPMFFWIISPILFFGVTNEWAAFFASPVNIFFGFGTLTGIVFCRFGPLLDLTPWASVLVFISILALACVLGYRRDALGEVVFVGVLCSLCIFFAATARAFSGVVHRALKVLGDASYSLYLTHMIVIPVVLTASCKIYPNDYVAVLSGLIISILFSIAVYVLIEKPVLAKLRRFTAR